MFDSYVIYNEAWLLMFNVTGFNKHIDPCMHAIVCVYLDKNWPKSSVFRSLAIRNHREKQNKFEISHFSAKLKKGRKNIKSCVYVSK